MISFPGSKINIGLNIVGKRADGYHLLESIFYPLNLSDILEIVKSDHFKISTTGLPIKGDHSDNLIVQAYYLLQDIYNLPPVHIHLHKIVPMGAGLGGGSADGAATLVLLNKLFNLGINTIDLERYADQLGSDCAFFVCNTPAIVQGKGDRINPIDFNLKKHYIQLINPGIHISTKEAFGGIPISIKKNNLTDLAIENPKNWNTNIVNDFEITIFPSHPEIEAIKKTLYENGALYASMTGTGSSVYGIFEKTPKTLKIKAGYDHYFEWISLL